MPNRYFKFLDCKFILSVLLILCFGQISFSQTPTPGDYRSVTSGAWTTPATWQVRSAAGTWSVALSAPTSANNVYIQAGHNVTVGSAVSCNDLQLGYISSPGTRLVLGTNVLSVNGKLRSYNGTVVTSTSDGTFYSSQSGNSTIPENLITSSGVGKIKFIGNTRNITESNSWGTYGTAFATEFALNAGQTGTLQTGFKSSRIEITSGTVNSGANRLAPDDGNTDGGTLFIGSGATFVTSADITKTGSSRASLLTLDAGSTLELTAAIPQFAFKNVSIDPASTINYSGTAANQYFVSPLYSGTSILNYGNLILSGTGTKWMNINGIVVKGDLTITGSAMLNNQNHPFSLEKNWSSSGTGAYDPSGGDTIRFSGSGAQQINSGTGINFKYVAKTGSQTLTQNGNVAIATNGYLGIQAGTWDAGAYSLSSVSAGSVLTQNVNTTLILGKTGVPLPEFAGTMTFGTGSTLVLNGAGAQQLKGGLDYKNLSFTNSTSTTLVSNPTSIVGTVSISGTAVLDIGNSNGFGNASTNLTMTGGRFKMSGVSSTKPDIDGTYNLTGGVIEFNGSGATRQNIKGKTAAGSADINYFGIEVSGNNVGMGLYNIVMLSNTNAVFKILNGGVFTINDNTIKSATTALAKFTMDGGSTLYCGNNQGFHGFSQAGLNSSAINSNISASSITLSPGSTIIYSGTVNQPITNTVNYQNLIIDGTGIKTASSGTTTIQGDLTKSGTSSFVNNNGTFVMLNSSAGQNIYCSSSTPISFSTLWVRNTSSAGLNIQNDISIETKLQFSANIKLFLQSGNVIMKSTATKTASIGAFTGSPTQVDYPGTGRFIIERFIDIGSSGSHGKSWQLLATPTNGGQTIKEAWQEGNAPMVVGTPGYGTIISNNLAGNGFDIIGGVGPSMKTYVPATNVWKGISRTDTTLYNPNGYMIFVRGDRTVTTSSAAATTTVLRTKGKIFYNTNSSLNPSASVSIPTNEFQTVGNPHASEISFPLTQRTNLQGVFYVWDPKLGSGYGYGAYQTFFENPPASGQFEILLGGGSYGAAGTINNYIESGQAFFVHSAGSGSAISFPETCKTDGSRLVTRTAAPQSDNSMIRAKLISLGTDELLTDGVLINFSGQFDNSIDQLDILKMINSGENLSVKSSEQLLSVERRSLPGNNDTIWLNLGNLHEQDYRLDFAVANFNSATGKPVLVDRFLNESYNISESENTSYTFTASASAPGSYAPNRFCIVFKKAKKEILVTDLNTEVIAIKKAKNNDDALSPEFQVYPNPAQGNFVTIILPEGRTGKYGVELSDAAGKILSLQTKYVDSRNIRVDVSGIRSGMYFIQLKGPEGYTASRKLVISK
jgi:hypothetical protein